MPKLKKKDVLHIAELSNLKLSEDEIEKFTPQLDKIIEFVASLSEVNTDDVVATNQTTGLTNVAREDKVVSENILTHEQALSGTDNIHNGMIKVSKILQNRS